MKLTRNPFLAVALVSAASLITSAHAATATKGATAGANWSATTAGAWSGGDGSNGAPASGDDVLVTTGSVNPTSNVIGGDLSWNKITIDRNALVTFDNSAGATLNLGAGGITVTSTAAAGSGNSSVQLKSALSLVDQTWTIASGKGIVLNSANYTDGGIARTINVQGGTAGTTNANFRVGGTGNGTVNNTGTWLGTSTINMKDIAYQLNGSSTNFSNSNDANSGALLTFDNVLFSTGNNNSARSLASSTKLLGNISTGAQNVATGAGYNLIGTMDLDGGTRTITTGSQATGTFNTLISGVISNGGLTKAGTGTLALSGTNTYTGNTTVSAGTLVVNGSISTSSLTTVNTGGTLGGTGTTGSVTIDSGGIFAPGVGGIESLNIDGTLTLSAGSFSNFEINTAGGSSDLAIASALLAFGGTLNVTNIGGPLVLNDTFNLFDWGSTSGAFSAVNLPALDPGLSWDESALYTSGALTVIPEPNVAALIGGFGMLTLLRRRRN